MITINYRDGRPIYEQVKEQLRRLLISGALSPGEKLPSVRELAGQLAINPNTIQRAYRELEAEGFILSVPGKGSFAAPRPAAAEDPRAAGLWQRLEQTAGELRELGFSAEEILQRTKGVFENGEH